MDQVLDEIKKLREDLNLGRTVYLTFQTTWGSNGAYSIETVKVFEKPRDAISYLEEEECFNFSITENELEKLGIGETIEEDKYKILKTFISNN